MKTLIRLLLKEQSDLGLHCLPRPICPKILDHYGISSLTKQDLMTSFIKLVVKLTKADVGIPCIHLNVNII